MHEKDDDFIRTTVERLSSSELLNTVLYNTSHAPMPSGEVLREVMDDLRTIIFPGFFGYSDMSHQSLEYYTGALLDRVNHKLARQIERGLCFTCNAVEDGDCKECELSSKRIAQDLIEKLPDLRALLASDALAAFEGDPAARSIGEVIFCYPSIRAMTNQRVAHVLFQLGVPIIPRIITELAHSETGIDIHPGASIGEGFFIDHGTGVVIGETSNIGKNVRLYQGVTLGAKSFPVDASGNPLKGIPRHPIVEDDVVIYAGATILGRITVGKGSVIGANVWVTSDVPPESKVMQR